MLSAVRHRSIPAIALGIVIAGAGAPAQNSPVAAMFASDQKRNAGFGASFVGLDLPRTATARASARVYLSAGDLARAFDDPAFRPDAAIVPTNTDLLLTAPEPGTQAVLVSRVQKHPAILRDLEAQLSARRTSLAPAGGPPAALQIGTDSVVVRLPRGASAQREGMAFPTSACLIATDFAKGNALDQRELFSQARFRKGIAACLGGLDAAGATSVVLPLMGAASSEPQQRDAFDEGQRVLKECRLINATAGIALGIHDYAGSRRGLREIGIVQWDEEIRGMFTALGEGQQAQNIRAAYANYAAQVSQTFRRGLAGTPTAASDMQGRCSGVLDVP